VGVTLVNKTLKMLTVMYTELYYPQRYTMNSMSLVLY
jgi:hypothetical protein